MKKKYEKPIMMIHMVEAIRILAESNIKNVNVYDDEEYQITDAL